MTVVKFVRVVHYVCVCVFEPQGRQHRVESVNACSPKLDEHPRYTESGMPSSIVYLGKDEELT